MQIIEVETKEGYDLWAPTYDMNGNPLVALEDFALNKFLGDVRGLRAIDLGCGTGRNSLKLHDLGAEVEGADFSAGMLARARASAEGRNISFRQCDLTQPLPYPDRTFDLVVSSLVVEHIQDLTSVFKEMGRICRTGGRILVSDLHPAMMLKDSRAQFTDHQSGRDIRPRGFAHSMSEYILAIRDSGLQVKDVAEHSGSAELAKKFPKMQKFVDWPMLVVFSLSP
jgi:ubiquinone/menaquinone biosynthesis C-methylase UbiE